MNIADAIVAGVLALVIWACFGNNPLRHGRRFMTRRFVNWFPLGMTYAFLYMARYNLSVAKTALGTPNPCARSAETRSGPLPCAASGVRYSGSKRSV